MTEPRHTHPVTPLVTMVRAAPVLIIGVFVIGGGEATRLLGGLGTGGLIALHSGRGRHLCLPLVDATHLLLRRRRRPSDPLGCVRSQRATRPAVSPAVGRRDTADPRPALRACRASPRGGRCLVRGNQAAVPVSRGRPAAARGTAREGVRTASGGGRARSRLRLSRCWSRCRRRTCSRPWCCSRRRSSSLLLIPAVVAVAGVSGVWELGLTGIFLVFAPVTVVGGQFLKYFGFTVAQSPDGLRLRFGLTSHRSQTVPPGRVQAVRIERPLMWKPWGWVRVVVNVAGATGGEEGEDRPSVVLPVAPLPVARAVLQQVLPGIDPFDVALTSAPASARWRAPLQHRQLGVGATPTVFVTRRGWLVPKWDVVPHARTQSVRLRQGPWQRRLGLASVLSTRPRGRCRSRHCTRTPATARILGAGAGRPCRTGSSSGWPRAAGESSGRAAGWLRTRGTAPTCRSGEGAMPCRPRRRAEARSVPRLRSTHPIAVGAACPSRLAKWSNEDHGQRDAERDQRLTRSAVGLVSSPR